MMTATDLERSAGVARAWWREVTFYQWVVLLVACAGWIFDIYENQIFMFVRGDMLGQLLGAPANSPQALRPIRPLRSNWSESSAPRLRLGSAERTLSEQCSTSRPAVNIGSPDGPARCAASATAAPAILA